MQLDMDMDSNHFDNFFGRRKRRPIRRKKVNRTLREMKARGKQKFTTLQSDMDDVRRRKRKSHKNVLRKMRTQGFFANPKNHRAVYKQVSQMAKQIDGLSQKLIEAKKPCECKTRGKAKYRNFGGENNLQTFWNKYKTPLLIGGAVYFFFFSPMGKKLIK